MQRFRDMLFFSFTRRVHKAFANTSHDMLDKAIPICTSSVHNKYDLCSSCCADRSCVCMSQAEVTASYNPTVPSCAACGAIRIGRTMKSRQQSQHHKRRRSDGRKERPPIPRANGGSSQDSCKVTFNQLFMPMSGLRKRATLSFHSNDVTINGALHRWLCCPDPPLIQEVASSFWNTLSNGEDWEHEVPWSFG